jgi:type IV pilus assembly protein PilM
MKKTLAMRSLLYSGDLLGVDLGTFAVKVLYMKAKERSLTVLGSAQRQVWRELSETKSEEEKTQIYARALKDLLAAGGFGVPNAAISLAGNVVILRFLTLPAGCDPDSDLPPEAKALIPFDESDACVSAMLQAAAKGDKRARPEMLMAVAQKKTVQSAMDVVRSAGLRPAVLINDVLALANAYQFFQPPKEDETIVLVNCGATSTSASVLENGVPKTARVFNIAGNAFTRAVKREFNVDLEEAEGLKTTHGLTAPGGKSAQEKEAAARVAQALGSPVKDLGGEILRTIDVFLERRPADYPPIRRIVLAGGSAELKGLPERLAVETGLTVDVFRPLVNVTAKNGGIGIAPLPAAFAVPCGLALSNTLVRRSVTTRINLIPRKVRRGAIIRDMTPGFWRLIAGPAIVVAALSLYGVWAVRVSRREAAEEQRLAAAAKAEKAIQDKIMKKKTAPPPPPPPVKRVEDPFAFLSRMSVTGVLGDHNNVVVMLDGGGRSFVARGGKLFDSNEEEVRGVSSEIRDNALALKAGGRSYAIAFPK